MASPSSLLARLDELKKWQEIQQEKLLKQHARKLEEVENFSTVSDYMSIPGLSLLDTSNDSGKTDELSRKTPEIKGISNKNGKKAIMDESEHVTLVDESKTKRPYLKRGAGLVRFKMKPGDQYKQLNKTSQTPNNNQNQKKNEEVNGNKVLVNDNPITPLKRPELTIKPKATWMPVANSSTDSNLKIKPVDTNHNPYTQNLIAQINELASNGLPSCSDFSDCEEKSKFSEKETKPSEQTLYERAIEKELQIFEDLEQRAMNSSFCSTNSSIVRLLSSTPQKCKTINEKCETNKDDCETKEVTIGQSIFEGHKRKSCNIGVVSEDEYVNLRQIYAKNYGIDVRAFIRENLHKLGDGADSSNNSEDNSSVTSEDLQQTVTADQTDFHDEEAWSDSCPSETAPAASRHETKTVAVQTVPEIKSTKCKCEENFAQKLSELNKEIQSFREESTKIKNLKRELEEEQRDLKRDRRKLQKELEEERIRLEYDLEQERKKFNKEKMVFERYVKDQQNKPTKKERQEITSLKVEVESLKETLKIKETRNATCQARLRNQIKSLEKENGNLKEDIDKLSKQNAKLAVNQKMSRKPSDTKILHQINKSLSKLTNEPKEVKKSAKKKEIEITTSSESDSDSLIEEAATTTTHARTKTQSTRSSLEISENTPERDESKENNRNGTNMETGPNFDANDDLLERNYEKMFADFEVPQKLENNSLNETTQRSANKNENILGDGTKEIVYANGNVKTVSPDGNSIRITFFNGDVKETRLLDGVIKYCYAANKIWHTTFADGHELLEFPDGQTEKRFPDGSIEVHFGNGLIRHVNKSGAEKAIYPDGTVVTVSSDGEKVMLLPNGQKEIHTQAHMRREYPDGTVKILYPDGMQETRYSNGRIRLKNKNGDLLMDSHDENI